MSITGDYARTAHMLRRFGLGASQAEIDFYSSDGWRSAVEKLISCESIEEPVVYTTEFLKDQEGRMPPNPIQTQTMVYAWLLTTRRPLQAKMTVFWHDHFATSSEKVSNGPAMYQHWNTLWNGSLGKFEPLLLSISQDPAMLYWLDNIENVKGIANENFARELLELFTLGVDEYNETDVKEIARAFTGWSYGFEVSSGAVRPNRGQVPRLNSRFVFDEAEHDPGIKTIFGQSKEWTGEEVIRFICQLSRTALFIVEKVWTYFVYDNPSKTVLEKHAKAFLESGLDIKVLVKNILIDEEFYSDKADHSKIKNPVDFCVPALRQLGIGESLISALENYTHTSGRTTRSRLNVARSLHKATEEMGMALLLPPDVSGWPNQLQWVSTATMIERMKWSEFLFEGNGIGQVASSVIAPIGVSADKVVANLIDVFDAKVSGETREKLVSSVDGSLKGGSLSLQNQSEIGKLVTRLLFGSPEFQFM